MQFAILFFLLNQFFIPSQEFFFTQFESDQFETVTIGNQEWMTTNWNYPTPKSFYYNQDSTINKSYGKLYFYSNAMAAVPPGFHLPTMDDWWELINFLGGPNNAAKEMMVGGSSGLNLPFAGYKSANISPEDMFAFIEYYAFYWTSTPDGEQTSYAIHIDNQFVITFEAYRKANGFSVRYIKNK